MIDDIQNTMCDGELLAVFYCDSGVDALRVVDSAYSNPVFASSGHCIHSSYDVGKYARHALRVRHSNDSSSMSQVDRWKLVRFFVVISSAKYLTWSSEKVCELLK